MRLNVTSILTTINECTAYMWAHRTNHVLMPKDSSEPSIQITPHFKNNTPMGTQMGASISATHKMRALGVKMPHCVTQKLGMTLMLHFVPGIRWSPYCQTQRVRDKHEYTLQHNTPDFMTRWNCSTKCIHTAAFLKQYSVQI